MRALVLAAAIVVAACSPQPDAPLVARDVVITRPVASMGMSAAYLSLTNNTDKAMRISHADSPQYDSVELHETRIEDGIARMRAMPALEIPAGETVRLQRGGKHLMLMRPAGPVDTVTLNFYDNETLLLTVAARIEPEGV